jgi:hypothetical protein
LDTREPRIFHPGTFLAKVLQVLLCNLFALVHSNCLLAVGYEEYESGKTLLAPARKLATGYMTPKNLEKKYEKSLCFKKFDLSSYPKHKNI